MKTPNQLIEQIVAAFYDEKECIKEMNNHQSFGLLKDRIHYFYVLRIESEGIWYINFDGEPTFYVFSTNHKQEEIMFADGTPFGIKEE